MEWNFHTQWRCEYHVRILEYLPIFELRTRRQIFACSNNNSGSNPQKHNESFHAILFMKFLNYLMRITRIWLFLVFRSMTSIISSTFLFACSPSLFVLLHFLLKLKCFFKTSNPSLTAWFELIMTYPWVGCPVLGLTVIQRLCKPDTCYEIFDENSVHPRSSKCPSLLLCNNLSMVVVLTIHSRKNPRRFWGNSKSVGITIVFGKYLYMTTLRYQD